MTGVKYDYAVVVALDEESEYFTTVVTCGEAFAHKESTCWPITDSNWKPFGSGILVCSGEMGIIAAERSAKHAIYDFGVKTLANIGIAGRVDSSLQLGDVLVPDLIIDVTQGGKVGGTQGQPQFTHKPTPRMVPGELAHMAHVHLKGNSSHLLSVNERLQSRFEPIGILPKRGIRVISKPVACVPNVGAHDTYRESLVALGRTISGMEMESAGILMAAGAKVDVICVRGISDGADFDKRALEEKYKDENRRFATEAAVAVLESVLRLQYEKSDLGPPDGVSVTGPSDAGHQTWGNEYELHEKLFSLLVHTERGESVEQPIRHIATLLKSRSYGGPIVIFGDKGAGKTTFFRYLHRALALPEDPAISVLLCLNDLEVWRGGEPEIDPERTQARVRRAREYIVRIVRETKNPLYLIVDGLNRTGEHRLGFIAEILPAVGDAPNVRLILSAESPLDLRSLYRRHRLDVHSNFSLVPMDIENRGLPS